MHKTDLLPSVILASTSPRRRSLSEKLPFQFQYAAPSYDEPDYLHEEHGSPVNYVQLLALEKARSVNVQLSKTSSTHPILSLDTTVILDNLSLGKPKNREEALSMLLRLSGRWHQVATGYALLYRGQEKTGVEITEIHIPHLSSSDANSFLEKEEWMDKAGAYGIQTHGALIIDQIKGCYYNAVGFPLYSINKLLMQELLGRDE